MIKFLLYIFLFFTLPLSSFANEVNQPKGLLERLGIDSKIEKNVIYLEKHPTLQKKASEIKKDSKLNYASMDLRRTVSEVSQELEEEEAIILNDLRVLWQAACMKSETIKFAIYKLSNPEGDKIDPTAMQRILTPIANITPFAAMGASTPGVASTAILSGGLLGAYTSTDADEYNAKLTRVNDADLVILAKEIEELQTRLVKNYYDYISSYIILNKTDEILANRYKYFETAKEQNLDNVGLADTFYRDALDKQQKAQQDFMLKRTTLEQTVGNDALIEVEEALKQRYKLNIS